MLSSTANLLSGPFLLFKLNIKAFQNVHVWFTFSFHLDFSPSSKDTNEKRNGEGNQPEGREESKT